MSYPRKLHLLIVENEQEPIDGYLALLKEFGKEYPIAPPQVSRSYADAVTRLQSDSAFHLVILDLNLPLADGEDPPPGLAPGEQLLDLIARRDAYPVPVCLVISGLLNLARLSDLQGRLARDFCHGATVNKGPDLPAELRRGLDQALAYADVGIHVRDGGRATYPTVTPREEDLLRRCVLAQPHGIGLDLEWWAAAAGPTTVPSADAGPTKVLMGRLLLDAGFGRACPSFFKFEPASWGRRTAHDATLLDHKLSHVKVRHCGGSHERSLLVTQSVTDQRPVRLTDFLARDSTAVAPHLPGLVADVTRQLDALAVSTPDQVEARTALWPHHNTQTLSAGLGTGARTSLKANTPGPIEVFERLRACTRHVWTKRRACTHGDLNCTNVAIEDSPTGPPRAFIFDPGGVHADFAARDLAALEITTVLFATDPAIDPHFLRLRDWYTAAPAATPTADAPPAIRNLQAFVSQVRAAVAADGDAALYPYLLFDAALVQLGGLVFRQHNKVAHASRVRLLAEWVAEWVDKLLLDAGIAT